MDALVRAVEGPRRAAGDRRVERADDKRRLHRNQPRECEHAHEDRLRRPSFMVGCGHAADPAGTAL